MWCRLFDELDHKKIAGEFSAIIKILNAARMGKISIVRSEVLFYELSKIKGEEKEAVKALVNEVSNELVVTSEKTRKIFEGVARECGLNAVDALHIALAVEHDVDVFLTTDGEVLNKGECIKRCGIDVKNPVDYGV